MGTYSVLEDFAQIFTAITTLRSTLLLCSSVLGKNMATNLNRYTVSRGSSFAFYILYGPLLFRVDMRLNKSCL